MLLEPTVAPLEGHWKTTGRPLEGDLDRIQTFAMAALSLIIDFLSFLSAG